MTPIEKNIIVVDEQGNQYEATYPKRAKGLVKNGRARFVGENKICLACPPNRNLEDNEMPEDKKIENEQTAPTEKLSINYILGQIERIAEQTAHLHEAIAALGEIEEIDSCVDVGSGKAKAIADVVRCRETTNQQLLKLYEKMYDDLKPQPPTDILREILCHIDELPPDAAQQSLMKIYEQSGLTAKFDEVGAWLKTQNRDEYAPEAWEALTEAAKAQLSRHW